MTIQFRLGGKAIYITNAPPRGTGGDLRTQSVSPSDLNKLRQLLAAEIGKAAGNLTDAKVLEMVSQRVEAGQWSQVVLGSAELLGGSAAAKTAETADQAANAASSKKGSSGLDSASDKNTWVEIELIDQDCHPLRGVRVEVTLPDGKVMPGTLSDEGVFRVNNIDIGSSKVTFPDLDGREWSRSGKIAEGKSVPGFTAVPKLGMGAYTVKQGDYIASLAYDAGFLSWKTVWEDAKNASLREKRNPNVLFPSDVVQIPARQKKVEDAPPTERTTFQTIGDPVTVKLVVLSWDGTPLSSADVQFKLGAAESMKTAEDGSAKKNLDPTGAKEGDLLVKGFSLPLKLGHLDPAEEFSGQVWRLNNLGYRAGSPASKEDDAFRSAVEEFQCDNSVSVSGICDGATQDKLRTVHGS